MIPGLSYSKVLISKGHDINMCASINICMDDRKLPLEQVNICKCDTENYFDLYD